jgi:hypothetical protein
MNNKLFGIILKTREIITFSTGICLKYSALTFSNSILKKYHRQALLNAKRK